MKKVCAIVLLFVLAINVSAQSTGYTFYKNVRALKLTVVDSKVTQQSYENIDIYIKNTRYYHKYNSYTYNVVHSDYHSSYLSVDFPGCKYWSMQLGNSSVSYYYFFNY